MSKINILDLLQQDIEDVKGLIEYDKYGMCQKDMKKQARGILLNLQEHLEDFIQE